MPSRPPRWPERQQKTPQKLPRQQLQKRPRNAHAGGIGVDPGRGLLIAGAAAGDDAATPPDRHPLHLLLRLPRRRRRRHHHRGLRRDGVATTGRAARGPPVRRAARAAQALLTSRSPSRQATMMTAHGRQRRRGEDTAKERKAERQVKKRGGPAHEAEARGQHGRAASARQVRHGRLKTTGPCRPSGRRRATVSARMPAARSRARLKGRNRIPTTTSMRLSFVRWIFTAGPIIGWRMVRLRSTSGRTSDTGTPTAVAVVRADDASIVVRLASRRGSV